MRPYQVVIAVGVIVYLYSLLLSFYYLLPVNERNNKFIPGKIASMRANKLHRVND